MPAHAHTASGHHEHAHNQSAHNPGGYPGVEGKALSAMAASATLHCLTGCAIGEILGLMIGTALGLAVGWTIALSVSLAFFFGYALSTLPLLQAGVGFTAALSLVLAADTLSIVVMEVVDNAVMALVPGAMDAGLVNPVFWLSMMLALSVAFAAAYPVNRYLLRRGKGHALMHHVHDMSGPSTTHDSAPERRPRKGVAINTNTLAAALIGFLLGGLVVSIAAELEVSGDSPRSETSTDQPVHSPG